MKELGLSTLKLWCVVLSCLFAIGFSAYSNEEKNKLPIKGTVIPLPMAHSHNDYAHDVPLYDALNHGFTGIEPDIFVKYNGEQMHDKGNRFVSVAMYGNKVIQVHQHQDYGNNDYYYNMGIIQGDKVDWQGGIKMDDHGHEYISVAMYKDKVIVVHKSEHEDNNKYYYKLGTVNDNTVDWGDEGGIKTGDAGADFISVAMYGNNIITAHKGEDDDDSYYYNLGTIDENSDNVSWSGARRIENDKGTKYISVAMYGNKIITVYCTNDNEYMYNLGTITENEVTWFVKGAKPMNDKGDQFISVAMCKDKAIEMHRSENTEQYWYHIGNITLGERGIDWGESYMLVDEGDRFINVALTSAGDDSFNVIETHQSNSTFSDDYYYHFSRHLFADSAKLLVGHNEEELTSDRTLYNLYLKPIIDMYQQGEGYSSVYPNFGPITYMIDMKTSNSSYIKYMNRYLATTGVVNDLNLTGDEKYQKPLNVIISGYNKGDIDKEDIEYLSNTKERYIGIDGRVDEPLEYQNIQEYEYLFPRVSNAWNDRSNEALANNVNYAKGSNRQLRYWGAPDDEQFWNKLYDANTDNMNIQDSYSNVMNDPTIIISTDHLADLEKFLRKKEGDIK